MATGKNPRNRRFRTYGAILAALSTLPHAIAAERELKIEPSVTLKGEFHDRDAVVETAKWVMEIDPSINFRLASGDSSLSLRYSPRLLFTDLDSERSDVVHSLLAQGTLSFAAKRFQIGANMLIGEQGRDPLTPSLGTSLPVGERLRNFAVGTNFVARDNIASGVVGEVRGNYTFSDSSIVNRDVTTTSLSTPRSHSWKLATELKPSLRRPPLGLFAGAEYGQRTVSGQGEEAKSYKGYIGADLNQSVQYGLGVRVGYEQADFVTNGQELRGPYVDVSAEWRPNPRLEARTLLGWHYYGIGYELNAKWRAARTALELTARRAVVTSQEQVFFPATDSPLTLLDRFLVGSITDPAARAAEVTRLARVLGVPESLPEARYFYADRGALEEFARVSAVYSLPRWTMNAAIQYREVIPGASELNSLRADALRRTEDWQATFGTAYRLTAATTLRTDLTAERARTKADDRRFNRFRTNITLSHQWSRAVSTGGVIFYDRVRSDNVTAEYDDRGLGVFVRYQFN
jgi:uncharacterized protein (PEP-CTERM system associated)